MVPSCAPAPEDATPGPPLGLVGGECGEGNRAALPAGTRRIREKERGENGKERAHEAEVSGPCARSNSINNRRRLVNTAVITPNIKQPRWHLARGLPRAAPGSAGTGSQAPGPGLCVYLNLPSPRERPRPGDFRLNPGRRRRGGEPCARLTCAGRQAGSWFACIHHS